MTTYQRYHKDKFYEIYLRKWVSFKVPFCNNIVLGCAILKLTTVIIFRKLQDKI